MTDDSGAGRSLRESRWLMPVVILVIFAIIAVTTFRKVRPDLKPNAAALDSSR